MPYIGNKYEIGDHNNSWKTLDDISSYVATFDGSATNAVSTTNNTIRVPEHRFIQGQRVTYSNGGGGNIGGLTSGTAYYIIHDTNNEFKLATSLVNANNSTAINLSAVGSGTSHTVTAAFDGVNKKFKITYSGGKSSRFTSATQLSVAINNILQRPNDTATFTDGFRISDNEKIEFNVAPVAADIFWGSILSASLPTFDVSDNKLDNFTGNGSTTDFTLSHIPANNESIIVTVNGVVQHPTDKNGTRAYSLDASVLAFTAAPANGDEIQVRHIGFAGATSSSVTGFYGRTGNVTLNSSADNAIVGVITATSFHGDGSSLTGIDATALKDTNGTVRVQANTSGAVVTGVITATTFKGDGDFVELDVDGHTNLDNVSVSGVSTFSGNIFGTSDLTLTDTTADSAAGPEFKLFRNSASPADADYLGQIKFAGESDTGVERNYAKITGKILDASNGTEDGALEFAHIKAGSQTITGRWRSDSLQLLNGTNLTVAGTAEVTGTSTFGVVNITGSSTFTGNVLDFGESKQLRFGANNDFAILHNGNTLLENDTTGGHLIINNKSTSGKLFLNVSDGENALVATPDGKVEIFHDGNIKIETTNTGAKVTGNLQVTGVLTYEDVTNVDAVGIVTARSGIHIDDSITHIGDTNTKIRFPADDTVSVETAGQQNVQVTGARTLLKSPSGTNTTVRLQHQGNSGYGDIILDRQVNAFIIDNDPSNASNNQSYFSVKNKGTENLRIIHDGRIFTSGRTSYSGNTTCDDLVIGNGSGHRGIAISSGSSSEGGIHFGDGESGNSSYRGILAYNHADDSMQFRTAALERLRITSGGQVIIGATSVSPANSYSNNLVVSEASGDAGISIHGKNNSSNYASLYLSDAGAPSRAYLEAQLGGGANSNFTIGAVGVTRFLNNGSERARIDSTGRLLVGTTAGWGSSVKLHLGSSGNTYLTITSGTSHNGVIAFSDDGSERGSIDYDHNGDTLNFKANGITRATVSATAFWVDDGTNARLKLAPDSANLNMIISTTTGNGSYCNLLYGAADHIFKYGGTETARLSTAGNYTITGEFASAQDYPNYRPTLDFNFKAVKKLDPRITYERTGPASYVDENGYVVLVGDNTPRFDHDPETNECKGLLIEEQRTNLIPNSFDKGTWSAGSAGTLTRNAGLAPDGTNTATKASTTSNDIDVSPQVGPASAGATGQIAISGSTTYTLSIWAKASTSAQVGNNFKVRWKRVQGDSVSAETTFALTADWKRYSATGTTAANNSTIACYVGGVANSEALVWGAQLEAGNVVTSLIPTYNGTTATRGADIAVIDGQDFLDTYSPHEGSFIIDASIDDLATSNQAIFGAEKSSNRSGWLNMIGYRVGGNSSAKAAAWYIYNGAGSQGYLNGDNSGSVTAGVPFKAAYRYKYNDFAFTCNGGTVITDTSGPTVDLGTFNRFIFGSYHYNEIVSGHIRRVTTYSKGLSNSQLLTLTS